MRILTLAIILLTLPGFASAVPVLDQESLPGGTATGLNGHYTLTWQQEVTAGATGQLLGVEIWLYPGAGLFFVNPGPAYHPRHQVSGFAYSEYTVFSGRPGNPDWFYIDVTSSDIWLNADDKFVFGVQGVLGSGGWLYPLGYRSNPYDGGALYSQTGAVFGGDMDFAFRTYMSTIAINEPASPALLLLGASILAFRWRRPVPA